jgi:hypothetical protein
LNLSTAAAYIHIGIAYMLPNVSNQQHEDEFLRIPSRGEKCPITGLSRTSVEEIVVPSKKNNFNPPVRARLRRKPGKLRGIWLIPRQEYIRYFNKLPTSR